MKRRKVGTDRPLEPETCFTFATFTDLPDELLAKVVEDPLEDETLFRLSLTCKRLHFLVLPMFFSRHGLKNPECGSFRYHNAPPETLEAVRMALFVRNLSTVACQLTSRIDQAMSEVSSLRGLLTRIPPVGEISLGLPNHLLYWRPPQRVRNRKVEKWEGDFLKLLRTIVERGCRDLELYDPIKWDPNSSYIVPSSATEPPTAPVDCRGLRSRAVPLKPQPFRAGKPILPVHPPSIAMSTLKILSWKLFRPFFIGWVIDTLELNRESIVCIHLNIGSLSPVLLSGLSKSLNLPAVKEVNIFSEFGVEWVDLRPFLDRHPSITDLCLNGIFPSKNPQSLDAPIQLPCLTHLAATLPIITWLLGCRNAVPLLTSVNVLLNPKAAADVDDTLQTVAIHSHIVSLRLTIGMGADIFSLMARHVREDKSTRIIASLNHIKILSVESDRNFVYGPVGPSTLKRWLYLFPCLEHLALDFCLLDAGLELPAEARHNKVTEFASQVAAERPMMKTLSINSFETVDLDELRGMPGFKGAPSAESRKSNRVSNKKGKAQCSCN